MYDSIINFISFQILKCNQAQGILVFNATIIHLNLIYNIITPSPLASNSDTIKTH